MADKIIYQLFELKKYFGQKEVLKGITLSFLEGAKIGIIGPNGAGKSTLLRIIAGVDKQFEGTARPIAGLTIGYLAQEPPLNEELDVECNLKEAVAPLLEIERRYNELAEAGEMGEEVEKLSEEMAHKEIWELDSHLEQAAEALGLPPMDADVKKLSGG
jgi:ATPase subunit of ABC transporter with duplicated ATPase domains